MSDVPRFEKLYAAAKKQNRKLHALLLAHEAESLRLQQRIDELERDNETLRADARLRQHLMMCQQQHDARVASLAIGPLDYGQQQLDLI